VLLVEEVDNDQWLLLATTQARAGSSDEYCSSSRALASDRVGRVVVLEQLVGVEFEAEGRKEIRPKQFVVRFDEDFGFPGLVRRVTVDDDEDLASVHLLE
jgi:hypothetical protein